MWGYTSAPVMVSVEAGGGQPVCLNPAEGIEGRRTLWQGLALRRTTRVLGLAEWPLLAWQAVVSAHACHAAGLVVAGSCPG